MKIGLLSHRAKWGLVGVGVVAVIAISVGISIGIYFAVRDKPCSGVTSDGRLDPPDPNEPLPPSESLLGIYQNAAVTSNGPPCAEVGRDILLRNGSAVEAAIASLFCEGVTCLQSMGIGGGFLMTIYERATGKATVLNARETAPAAAHQDMFNGDSNASRFGGKAAAVPGEVKGYWEAFNRFKSGNLEWADLIQPTIDLCMEGSSVSSYLATMLRNKENQIYNSPTLREILINPATNRTWVAGDRIKRVKLAETLRVIATDPLQGEALYSGDLARRFVRDVQDLGGIITMEDMASYRVRWEDPVNTTLSDGTIMYSVPPPGAGVLVAFILNILNNFIPVADDVTTQQRIVEAFKYGFGKRTELGDPSFVDIRDLIANLTSTHYADIIRSQIADDRTFQDPEHYGAVVLQPDDHGTAHISVVAPNGDAVSVTSTINLVLGAMVRSTSTGIILNDEMDDFSYPNITNGFGVPPSPANFVKPGKRPVSSMCPSIFVDKNGDVRLVVGAAGGTKITTSTILVSLHNLFLEKDIKRALDANRFHHQLFPMHLQYEYGMVASDVRGLGAIGHNMSRYTGGSSVTAIARESNTLYANADFRRSGSTAGF